MFVMTLIITLPLSAQCEKKLKKSEDYIQKKEGYIYQWFECGDAVYSLNGKQLFSFDGYVFYKGGGLFSCQNYGRENKYGEKILIVYDTTGNIIFPEEFGAIHLYYCGNDYFSVEINGINGKEIPALYRGNGECVIPFSAGFKKVGYNKKADLIYVYDNQDREIQYSPDLQYYYAVPPEVIGDGGDGGKRLFERFKQKVPTNSKIKPKLSDNAMYYCSNAGVVNKSKNKTESELNNIDKDGSGLLYEGMYTVTCQGVSTIDNYKIYETHIYNGFVYAEFKGMSSSGNRIYRGDAPFGTTEEYVVYPDFRMGLVRTYISLYGSSKETCTVTKGETKISSPSVGGFDAGNGGGSGGIQSGTGKTNNPVQPHQKKKMCTSCNHSGQCPNCNGKGSRNVRGTIVRCTNCGGNGRCPYCGGTGEKTTVEYY